MNYQPPSRTTETLAVIARFLGLVMLIVGLFIGIKVIFEAWNLYDEPQRIERFAKAIDQGSNLDNLITSFSQKRPSNESDVEQVTAAQPSTQQPSLRVSYFLAWIVAILLLMVITIKRCKPMQIRFTVLIPWEIMKSMIQQTHDILLQ